LKEIVIPSSPKLKEYHRFYEQARYFLSHCFVHVLDEWEKSGNEKEAVLKGDEESDVAKWKKYRSEGEKYFNQREDEIKNEEDDGLGEDRGMNRKL
jgi:hypothetical protein